MLMVPKDRRRSRWAADLRHIKGFSQTLLAQTAQLNSPSSTSYTQALLAIDLAGAALLITPSDDATAAAQVRQRYATAARAGTMKPLLTDDRRLWADAAADVEFAKLLLRDSLQTPVGSSLEDSDFKGIVAFVDQHPASAELHAYVQSLLPQTRFSLQALKGSVQAAYPDYAAAQLATRVVPLYFDLDVDPVLEEDMGRILESVDSIRFSATPKANVTRSVSGSFHSR